MASAHPSVQLLCRQCSAPLPVEQGAKLVECEYCGTTNYVEKGRTVFHYVVRTTVRENDALAALRRWMGGNQTVKDLDKKAKIEVTNFQLFPMWFTRVSSGNGEKVIMEPAAALSVSELKQSSIPAADLEPFDPTYDEDAITATVPYDALMQWLADNHGVQPSDVQEVSLVHLPIYQCKYSFDGRRYTAVVDAATSEVFANIYPSKWEVPYLAIGAAAFAAFFCASLIPAISFLSGGFAGFGLGMGIYAVAVIVLSVVFFGAAAVISSRV
jgi:LSD1 subclass zinc finger protein